LTIISNPAARRRIPLTGGRSDSPDGRDGELDRPELKSNFIGGKKKLLATCPCYLFTKRGVI
jgi:hypothetical protein